MQQQHYYHLYHQEIPNDLNLYQNMAINKINYTSGPVSFNSTRVTFDGKNIPFKREKKPFDSSSGSGLFSAGFGIGALSARDIFFGEIYGDFVGSVLVGTAVIFGEFADLVVDNDGGTVVGYSALRGETGLIGGCNGGFEGEILLVFGCDGG